MSMITPGRKMPRNDIDVYLQPLINELWTTSVDAYDSFKQEIFKLHATLIWTTNDFPGLATLYRWKTYTGLASHLVTLTLHPIISKLAANDVFGNIIVFLIRGIDLD